MERRLLFLFFFFGLSEGYLLKGSRGIELRPITRNPHLKHRLIMQNQLLQEFKMKMSDTSWDGVIYPPIQMFLCVRQKPFGSPDFWEFGWCSEFHAKMGAQMVVVTENSPWMWDFISTQCEFPLSVYSQEHGETYENMFHICDDSPMPKIEEYWIPSRKLAPVLDNCLRICLDPVEPVEDDDLDFLPKDLDFPISQNSYEVLCNGEKVPFRSEFRLSPPIHFGVPLEPKFRVTNHMLLMTIFKADPKLRFKEYKPILQLSIGCDLSGNPNFNPVDYHHVKDKRDSEELLIKIPQPLTAIRYTGSNYPSICKHPMEFHYENDDGKLINKTLLGCVQDMDQLNLRTFQPKDFPFPNRTDARDCFFFCMNEIDEQVVELPLERFSLTLSDNFNNSLTLISSFVPIDRKFINSRIEMGDGNFLAVDIRRLIPNSFEGISVRFAPQKDRANALFAGIPEGYSFKFVSKSKCTNGVSFDVKVSNQEQSTVYEEHVDLIVLNMGAYQLIVNSSVADGLYGCFIPTLPPDREIRVPLRFNDRGSRAVVDTQNYRGFMRSYYKAFLSAAVIFIFVSAMCVVLIAFTLMASSGG